MRLTLPDNIPRGIEILVKKASVDHAFRSLLIQNRSLAAAEISLGLTPEEILVIDGIPEEQLQTIIARTRVPEKHVPVFLGKAAALMFGALTLLSASCGTPGAPVTLGVTPGPAPYASFSYAPETPDTAAAVDFTDLSIDYDGDIVSWEWDFGPDATPPGSIAQNPSVTFNTSGQHTVTLTVTDNDGYTSTYTVTIDVN